MGVSQHIVQWLRQKGDDAVHLRDQGLQKLPDSTIFDVIQRLTSALAFRNELEKGAIILVEETRLRIRRLPIGKPNGP